MPEIETALHFREADRVAALNAFCTLAPPLLPKRYSFDEDALGKTLTKDALEGLATRQEGFFLRADSALYDFGSSINGRFVCNCWLQVQPNVIPGFLEHMLSAKPIFAFACHPEERLYRNRVTVKFDDKTLEAWVGRDPLKAIPGLFWITVIDQSLIDRHGVPVDTLSPHAIEKSKSANGQYIFRFFDEPNSWKLVKTKIDTLCSSIPGIFDINAVRNGMPRNARYLELSTYLAQWR